LFYGYLHTHVYVVYAHGRLLRFTVGYVHTRTHTVTRSLHTCWVAVYVTVTRTRVTLPRLHTHGFYTLHGLFTVGWLRYTHTLVGRLHVGYGCGWFTVGWLPFTFTVVLVAGPRWLDTRLHTRYGCPHATHTHAHHVTRLVTVTRSVRYTRYTRLHTFTHGSHVVYRFTHVYRLHALGLRTPHVTHTRVYHIYTHTHTTPRFGLHRARFTLRTFTHTGFVYGWLHTTRYTRTVPGRLVTHAYRLLRTRGLRTVWLHGTTLLPRTHGLRAIYTHTRLHTVVYGSHLGLHTRYTTHTFTVRYITFTTFTVTFNGLHTLFTARWLRTLRLHVYHTHARSLHTTHTVTTLLHTYTRFTVYTRLVTVLHTVTGCLHTLRIGCSRLRLRGWFTHTHARVTTHGCPGWLDYHTPCHTDVYAHTHTVTCYYTRTHVPVVPVTTHTGWVALPHVYTHTRHATHTFASIYTTTVRYTHGSRLHTLQFTHLRTAAHYTVCWFVTRTCHWLVRLHTRFLSYRVLVVTPRSHITTRGRGLLPRHATPHTTAVVAVTVWLHVYAHTRLVGWTVGIWLVRYVPHTHTYGCYTTHGCGRSRSHYTTVIHTVGWLVGLPRTGLHTRLHTFCPIHLHRLPTQFPDGCHSYTTCVATGCCHTGWITFTHTTALRLIYYRHTFIYHTLVDLPPHCRFIHRTTTPLVYPYHTSTHTRARTRLHVTPHTAHTLVDLHTVGWLVTAIWLRLVAGYGRSTHTTPRYVYVRTVTVGYTLPHTPHRTPAPVTRLTVDTTHVTVHTTVTR